MIKLEHRETYVDGKKEEDSYVISKVYKVCFPDVMILKRDEMLELLEAVRKLQII